MCETSREGGHGLLCAAEKTPSILFRNRTRKWSGNCYYLSTAFGRWETASGFQDKNRRAARAYLQMMSLINIASVIYVPFKQRFNATTHLVKHSKALNHRAEILSKDQKQNIV